MKALVIIAIFYFAFAAASVTDARIPVITTFAGGRPAVLPDSSDPTYVWPQAVADELPTLAAMESDMTSKATHTAVANGKWSSTSTWGGSSIPGAGSVVRIPSDIAVLYDVDSDVALKDVLVQGALRWVRDQRTKMRVETIFATNTSYLDMGTTADPIPESGVAGTPQANIIYEGANPTTTMRLGLVTVGTVRICGAAKPEKLEVSVDPKAGDTTIQLNGDVSKWQVGDKIIVVAMSDAGKATSDPQYTGPTSYYDETGQAPENSPEGHKIGDWAFVGYKKSNDEVRTIKAINGNTITLDTALQYDHISRSVTLPRGQNVKITAIVASLSRSIRFESANPKGFRGHNMFMHSDDVVVRWAEALNMGRTRQDPSLYATNNDLLDKQGGTSVMDSNNVRGRYPWHTHLAGPSFARKMVIFEGLSAWAPSDEVPLPGWAITHHGGRAAIERCVVYNVRGAGIVSELGDEIGQWLHNVVCWVRGDGFRYGWGRRAERKINHNGSAGVAYENQARQILQKWNWATSSNIGWSFLQQNSDVLKRVPDHRALRFYDPWVGGGAPGIGDMDEGYGVEQAQIPEWQDNVCVGVGDGFFVAHRQFTNREDQIPMIAKNYHCIGVGRPVHIENYSWWYSFYDFVWLDGRGGSAIAYGDKTAAFNHANGYVRGYSRVADIKGYMVDGWFALIDHDCTDPNPYQIANVTLSATNYNDPTTHKLYKHSLRMGGWIKFGNNIIQPRPSPFKNDNEVNFNPATFTLINITNDVLDVNANRVHPLAFQGTISDGFGTRPYPHWSWFDAPADEGIREWQRSTEIPTRIVERNGCFYNESEGKWKSRMYFIDHNRLTGDYLIIPIDITLRNFNATFLEANKIVPQPPTLPLLPESISDDGSVPPFDNPDSPNQSAIPSADISSAYRPLISLFVIVAVIMSVYF